MARIEVPITQIERIVGTDPADGTAATDDGLMFQNDGQTYISLTNNGGGPHNITFITPQLVAGLAVADEGPHALAAGVTRIFGKFPIRTFNQNSGANEGKVYVDTDGTDTELEGLAFR